MYAPKIALEFVTSMVEACAEIIWNPTNGLIFRQTKAIAMLRKTYQRWNSQ